MLSLLERVSPNVLQALRVLKLLEDQHRRLAQILRTKDTVHVGTDGHDQRPQESAAKKDIVSAAATTSDEVDAPVHPRTGSNETAKPRLGTQQRDSSPSLARDIASRRGIPQPVRANRSPATKARARELSPDSSRKLPMERTSNSRSHVSASRTDSSQARQTKKAADDEGFANFYNNLSTGTMSKLSSVLAYAGLPLIPEDALVEPEPTTTQKSGRRTVKAGNDPDVKRIFSKAALDAIEDEHRKRGTLGHGFGPAESFYVVQKGGGTYSYADIARAQQQKGSNVPLDDEEPEFVDAKEVQGQLSPQQSRLARSARDSFGNPRTTEELDLENMTLKQTLHDLANRLAVFEAHAQDASFAALTQSVANLGPSGDRDMATQERLRQLEKQVETQAEEREKLEGLASKQEKMLKKYHLKFEEIKQSAREKDKVKRENAAAKQAGEPVVEP